MTAIFKYIQEFYQKEFKVVYFLVILLLLGIWIYLNYWHQLENRFAAGGKNKWHQFFGYYFLYFIPFAAAFFLQLLFYRNCSYYQNYWFWIILLLAPAFFSFRVNFDFHQSLIKNIWSGDLQIFWLRSLNWVVRVFVVLIPVFIIWWLKDRGNQPFYGIAALQHVKPYLVMLLIMIPLIALASTQKDFLTMYPKARFIETLDIPAKSWHIVLYELCYGFDFISIEFFFRGFLILSLLKICGPHCVIPVACFYCTIHFGKPMGEAISSFWGGLLLGIISYNTQSVWGGLIVHLGIAWLMEAGSWFGLLFKR
ncbi:MAG: CPBP family intramembrane metalloprotease [Chitinophagaceae bacterium]|nr:CPBP family intramembrane metalloprotease [Chitinophagaceae bacterium]